MNRKTFYCQYFFAVIDDGLIIRYIIDSRNYLYRLGKQLLYKADNVL